MGLKVLSMRDFLFSHTLLIIGLVLVTIGLLMGGMVLNIIGIWALALGLCLGVGNAFKRLATK